MKKYKYNKEACFKMEPKYKLHQRITEASKWELSFIGKKQMEWGFENCLYKFSYKSRGKIYCLECGHSWKPTSNRKKQRCPECLKMLKPQKYYHTNCIDAAYMAVVTVCGEYQVIRMIFLRKQMRLNHKPEYFGKEVMQHWIDAEANVTTMSLLVNGISSAADAWIWSSEMRIKEQKSYYSYNMNYRHNISPVKTYPEAQILPIFRRNGFRGDLHGVSPLEFFKELLRNQYFETLLKAKQYSLMRYSIARGMYNIWDAVKICIRNKYTVKDAQIWVDYIDLLRYFRKDTRNAHYVCPKNLKAEHDRLVVKKRKHQEEKEQKDKHRKITEANAVFIPAREKFFDIRITDGEIEIVVLSDVADFVIEGDEMHHCLFANEYYKKQDSLILSARKEQQRLETIELSLSRMEVIQSRGKFNRTTEFHDTIINMINQNIEQIKQRIAI